jgi:hypothetical protein
MTSRVWGSAFSFYRSRTGSNRDGFLKKEPPGDGKTQRLTMSKATYACSRLTVSYSVLWIARAAWA